MGRSEHSLLGKQCRAEPGPKQWQQHLWGSGPCPSAPCVPRPPFKGIAHVFWCARWMQLNICPCSGSVLYMVGYCQKMSQQQSISKCGLQLLLPGAQGCLDACKNNLHGRLEPVPALGPAKAVLKVTTFLDLLPGCRGFPWPQICAPPALGTSNADLMQQEWDHPKRHSWSCPHAHPCLSLPPPLLVTSVSEVLKEQRSSGLR